MATRANESGRSPLGAGTGVAAGGGVGSAEDGAVGGEIGEAEAGGTDGAELGAGGLVGSAARQPLRMVMHTREIGARNRGRMAAPE